MKNNDKKQLAFITGMILIVLSILTMVLFPYTRLFFLSAFIGTFIIIICFIIGLCLHELYKSLGD